MRQIFLGLLLGFIAFGFIVSDASAKGFGGGRGFGMMRSKSMFTAPLRAKRASVATATKQINANRWRGVLTGLLIGSLLTSLFMGHGFGSALIAWFAVGIIAYLIVNFIRRKRRDMLQ